MADHAPSASRSRRYDGHSAAELEALLRLPQVDLHDSVGSTLDIGHELAVSGAPAGTLVLAEEQTSGRGRGGKGWVSPKGAGLWITIIERPADASALDVLSLRLGLAAAETLDAFAGEPVGLKWPNDLRLAAGKLAGILVEVRWREQRVEWVAVGIGVNVHVPLGVPGAAGLRLATSRVTVLQRLIPRLREAAAKSGPLTLAELEAFAARDVARGRACDAPSRGTVAGITSTGGLRIRSDAGELVVHSGSLVLQEEA